MIRNWLSKLLTNDDAPTLLLNVRVAADASRCIQCGCCGYHCPVGIDVRTYARQGLSVDDPTCITCGGCINVCPRGTLNWESLPDEDDQP